MIQFARSYHTVVEEEGLATYCGFEIFFASPRFHPIPRNSHFKPTVIPTFLRFRLLQPTAILTAPRLVAEPARSPRAKHPSSPKTVHFKSYCSLTTSLLPPPNLLQSNQRSVLPPSKHVGKVARFDLGKKEKRKKGPPNLLRSPLFLTSFPTYCNSDFLHTPGFSRFTPNLLQLQIEEIPQSSVAFDFFSFCKSRRRVLRYHLSSNSLHPWNATPTSILAPAVKKQQGEKTQKKQKKKQNKNKNNPPQKKNTLSRKRAPAPPLSSTLFSIYTAKWQRGTA